MNTNELHGLLAQCIEGINKIGGSWWGGYVNRKEYPQSLQLVDGLPFKVTINHLSGIVFGVATTAMEHQRGAEYRLAYDPDRTKIDWGLANRLQATHFARIHSNVVSLPAQQTPLLELADVAAYTLVQKLIAKSKPNHRKARRFLEHANAMQISAAALKWKPPEHEIQ